MDKINQKLSDLNTLYWNLREIESIKERLLKQIIPADVLAAIKEVEEEYAVIINGIKNHIDSMEKSVKDDVVSLGKTVRGDGITVVYSEGKTTWDSELLEDYIAKHPKSKVAKAKKEPKPYASLRK